MDFKKTFTKTKEKIVTLVNKIIDFVKEDMRRTLIILISILIVILIILVIISVTKVSEKDKKNEAAPIVLSQELIIPEGPQVKQDYTVSRQPEEKWGIEETDNWFTVPSSKDVDDLSKANDNLILDVIGAAP